MPPVEKYKREKYERRIVRDTEVEGDGKSQKVKKARKKLDFLGTSVYLLFC